MSFSVRPAFFTATGMAYAGPTPMMAGSTPTAANDRRQPKIGRRAFSAALRRASRTRAAPSDTWEALPAVVEPSALKAGFNLASASGVVPARTPSSVSTDTFFSSPVLGSLTFTVMGTISSLNLPALMALSAKSCERAAKASCTWRVMPKRAATSSLV
eukprot:Mycagemm_TRINITY_DN9029_c0_g1::TRINITY_DN9029_c0_g1_i1::g.5345::m.5345 type:complete len:158 gc:universal TRINITY_DN9029_c0_g1_i1:49-522(+)